MSRQAFREGVFARDNHRCVICQAPAVDAHHIMERRLFPDGGYVLDNGVSLCAEHHLAAESTELSPDELRAAAGITQIILPPHYYRDETYDKWGNVYLANGLRAQGELFHDESVQKIIVGEFTKYVKHPRTRHLPWSPGVSDDDIKMADTERWNGRRVVITEKLDGENTTLYSDYVHARSLEANYHPTRSWVKNLYGQMGHNIPAGWRVSGENMQGKHSIGYELPTFFFVHSIWNEQNECLSWGDTQEWAALLDLQLVPTLVEPQLWTPELAESLRDCPFESSYGEDIEGYVVRITDAFPLSQFGESVGKWVRKDHIQTDRHWRQNWTSNTLIK